MNRARPFSTWDGNRDTSTVGRQQGNSERDSAVMLSIKGYTYSTVPFTGGGPPLSRYICYVTTQQQPSGQLTLPAIGQLVYGYLRGERVGAAEASALSGAGSSLSLLSPPPRLFTALVTPCCDELTVTTIGGSAAGSWPASGISWRQPPLYGDWSTRWAQCCTLMTAWCLDDSGSGLGSTLSVGTRRC